MSNEPKNNSQASIPEPEWKVSDISAIGSAIGADVVRHYNLMEQVAELEGISDKDLAKIGRKLMKIAHKLEAENIELCNRLRRLHEDL